jgi:hypothetical protein
MIPRTPLICKFVYTATLMSQEYAHQVMRLHSCRDRCSVLRVSREWRSPLAYHEHSRTYQIIIWRHGWYHWTILGIIGIASGVPFGGELSSSSVDLQLTYLVTVWRSSKQQITYVPLYLPIDSSGGGMYYTGLVILGAIFLCGAWAAVLPSRRKRRTIIMLGAFRDTIGDRIRTYWFIIACESFNRTRSWSDHQRVFATSRLGSLVHT